MSPKGGLRSLKRFREKWRHYLLQHTLRLFSTVPVNPPKGGNGAQCPIAVSRMIFHHESDKTAGERYIFYFS